MNLVEGCFFKLLKISIRWHIFLFFLCFYRRYLCIRYTFLIGFLLSKICTELFTYCTILHTIVSKMEVGMKFTLQARRFDRAMVLTNRRITAYDTGTQKNTPEHIIYKNVVLKSRIKSNSPWLEWRSNIPSTNKENSLVLYYHKRVARHLFCHSAGCLVSATKRQLHSIDKRTHLLTLASKRIKCSRKRFYWQKMLARQMFCGRFAFNSPESSFWGRFSTYWILFPSTSTLSYSFCDS